VRLKDSTDQASARFGLGLLFCVALAWGALLSEPFLSSTATVVAQDGEAEPAADAPAAEEPAGETSGGDSGGAQEQSFLMWMIQASGIFGAILMLLSIVMMALIMTNVMQVKRDVFIPDDFVNDFQAKLDAKDYKGAYELSKADDSLIARILAVGMSRLDRGYASAVEGMQEVGEEENMNYEHRLSYLALISSIAPMIGLMGTVYGMILSFQKIATATVAPKPSELADGISTALFTTLEGLAVAIPAMIAYSLLRNRVARYMLEVGMVSEGLMGRLPIGKPQQPSA